MGENGAENLLPFTSRRPPSDLERRVAADQGLAAGEQPVLVGGDAPQPLRVG
jgi:hypothetical protein